MGEIIDFPVADGKALYMVASLKPLELVHLPLGDAWAFQYVERLNVRDVKDIIKRNEALNKLFRKK